MDFVRLLQFLQDTLPTGASVTLTEKGLPLMWDPRKSTESLRLPFESAGLV